MAKLSGRKAVLLDAQEDQAVRVRQLLAKHHIELVEWFPSGAGWIAAWQQHKPELAIVDYALPKRDGLYCLEKLRELSVHCLTIFTHSYQGIPGNDLELKALARGALSVFQKPGTDERFNCMLTRFHAEYDKIQGLKKVKIPSPI